MNPIKVEISQFRIIDNGALKAFFTVVIHPEGLKIADCRYFIKDDNRWFTFPQKEVKYPDGRIQYFPYISYLNKDYQDQLKIAVLNALKEAKPQEKYGQQKDSSYQRQTNPLPTKTSPDYDDLPF